MPVATPWVRPLAARPNARLRLLCFHPAGGGPGLFRDWPTALPADIEVLAVHLPGRETRLDDPCLTNYQDAVAQLHTALRPFLSGSYALFGHSLGGLLAYGVAKAAARHGDPAPARLLVSGCAGPGSTPAKTGRGSWTDAELIKELREMGGTPEEILADPVLLDLILPPLRADYALCDSFAEPGGPPLGCPVSVLGGEDDHVSLADLRRWSATTGGGSSLRLFPGGHFFLLDPSADAVLTAVTADLGAGTSV
ncbi:thioesterase II family protein [Streptomyces gibsoniae]|uniref:Alpha/beta fold hydrolase n=1 Tax=Streptomyces gibsoniae TaxID=3075529 RepID=A0ABU2TMU9_9ACTN|nr:alpha/beta fold hydrolase [Streptomyces sp. DSM 41699]MDT0462181.1 alpha/beta fold hydrolase [Streptomyces sp. DSM 41699]